MKRIESFTVNNSEIFGTSVGFEIIFDEAPTSVTVEIFNPYMLSVGNVTATQDNTFTKRYTFTFESNDSSIVDYTGYWTAKISATYSGVVYKETLTFYLLDDEL